MIEISVDSEVNVPRSWPPRKVIVRGTAEYWLSDGKATITSNGQTIGIVEIKKPKRGSKMKVVTYTISGDDNPISYREIEPAIIELMRRGDGKQ